MARIVLSGKVIDDIELMIFDKDGTLICVHQYWASMVGFRADMICQYLGLAEEQYYGLMDSMGVNVKEMRIKPDGPVGIKKREIVMNAAVDYLANQGVASQEDLCRRLFTEVDEFSLSQLDRIIRPITGLYDLFDTLASSSCQIAIATTDLSERARLVMNHLGLGNRIDFIVGADMVTRTKPHTEMLEMILQELGKSPSQAVIVGDAPTDIKMGIEAGLRAAIGVASGMTPIEELKAITPYVVSDISDIVVNL